MTISQIITVIQSFGMSFKNVKYLIRKLESMLDDKDSKMILTENKHTLRNQLRVAYRGGIEAPKTYSILGFTEEDKQSNYLFL